MTRDADPAIDTAASEAAESDSPEAPAKRKAPPSVVILLAVVALFAGVVLAKAIVPGGATVAEAPQSAPTASDTYTSRRNDAMADYEAALQTGKPIFVLFHSLT